MLVLGWDLKSKLIFSLKIRTALFRTLLEGVRILSLAHRCITDWVWPYRTSSPDTLVATSTRFLAASLYLSSVIYALFLKYLALARGAAHPRANNKQAGVTISLSRLPLTSLSVWRAALRLPPPHADSGALVSLAKGPWRRRRSKES